MASSDNEDGRMLSLLEALFNGQKRTLSLVEAAIEKFSVVETEISKLNRKINIVHDAALHRHGEVMSKFDAKFSDVGTEISKLNGEINGVHQVSVRQHSDIISRFDAKFSDVGTEISKLNGEINGVHQVSARQHSDIISRFDEKFSVVEAEISKLNREMNVVHDVARRQHGEIMHRLDAVAARLEETERLLDDRSLDIKRTQIELVGQYNEILTALQLSANASRDVQDLDERLSELERRMQA